MPISLYNRKEKGGIKNEKIYIKVEMKKRHFQRRILSKRRKGKQSIESDFDL